MINGKNLAAALAALAIGAGAAQSSMASTCAVTDVTLSGASANYCGSGPAGDSIANTPVNSPQLAADYLGWDVNVNGDGDEGVDNEWKFFYKQDLNPDGTAFADWSFNADPINLQITSTGSNDNWHTGTFSLNAYDPMLIVLGDGAAYEYTWYLFLGYTGSQTGTWDTTNVFGGNDLSNITAYALEGDGLVPPSAIPVPAAVWLFGSGLLGLVGVARRKK